MTDYLLVFATHPITEVAWDWNADGNAFLSTYLLVSVAD